MTSLAENEGDRWTPEVLPFPQHWAKCEFEDVFSTISTNGKKIKQSQYLREGLFPVIDQGAEFIGGYTNDKSTVVNIDHPVIIFGDHTRCYKFVQTDFAPGADGIKILTSNQELSSRFLHFQCLVQKLPNRGYSRHFGFLKKLTFGIAPKREQDSIVSKIDELFSRIDAGEAALKRAKALVERYRKSILKAAVTGELTKDWREKNKDKIEPADQLLKRILKARREAWETAELAKMKAKGKLPKDDAWKKKYTEPTAPDMSELPELPEGWSWVSWAQVGKSQNGRPFPSSEYLNTGVKLLRPGNLFADGTVKWTERNTQCLPANFEAENPDHIIGPNELVINLTAQSLKDEFLGRVCLTGVEEHCLLNQRLARLTPILFNTSYMLAVFKSAVFRDFVLELNTGSLIQHMFTSQMEDFVFPLPPLAEQTQVALQIDRQNSSMTQLLVGLEASAVRAGVLRNSVLQSAFKGSLVPQNPDDEPAATLLNRIRSASPSAKPKKAKRGK